MNKSLGIYNIIDDKIIEKSIKNILNSNIDYNIYTTPKGLKELRIEISNFLNDIWNYEVSYNDMIITNGSQQSLNILSNVLLNNNDTIFVEQPTYSGTIKALKNKNINLVGIDLLEDGFNLLELEEKIKQYKPKIIYVTPTFNNPTGFVWSNKKRIEFLKIINKYNLLVIEDDPYSLINFTTNKYDSLYKLNNGKNIIYLGTFSKYISPSINVGYIITNAYINELYKEKELNDLCTSTFIQFIILDYLKNNNLKKLIDKKIPIYKDLYNKTIKYLKENNIEYRSSKGGLFIHLKFNDKIDYNIFENGNEYYIENNHNNESRINICFLDKN